MKPIQVASVNDLVRPKLTMFQSVLEGARESVQQMKRMQDIKLQSAQSVTAGLQESLADIQLEYGKTVNKSTELAQDRATKQMQANYNLLGKTMDNVGDMYRDIKDQELEIAKQNAITRRSTNEQNKIESRSKDNLALDAAKAGFKLGADGKPLVDENGNYIKDISVVSYDPDDMLKLSGTASPYFKTTPEFDAKTNTFTVTKNNGQTTQMTPEELTGMVENMRNPNTKPLDLRRNYPGIEDAITNSLPNANVYVSDSEIPIEEQLAQFKNGDTYNLPPRELNRLITISAKDPEAKAFLTDGRFDVQFDQNFINPEHINTLNTIIANEELYLKDGDTLGNLQNRAAKANASKKAGVDSKMLTRMIAALAAKGIDPTMSMKKLAEQGYVIPNETKYWGFKTVYYQLNTDKILGVKSAVATPTPEPKPAPSGYNPNLDDPFKSNSSS